MYHFVLLLNYVVGSTMICFPKGNACQFDLNLSEIRHKLLQCMLLKIIIEYYCIFSRQEDCLPKG